MRHRKDGNYSQRRAEWHAKRKRNTAVPVIRKPELFDDLIPTWQAWKALHLTRSVGMRVCGLSWSELSRYAEDHEMHGEERRRFCRIMLAVDEAYLDDLARKQEAKNASSRAERRREWGAVGSSESEPGA